MADELLGAGEVLGAVLAVVAEGEDDLAAVDPAAPVDRADPGAQAGESRAEGIGSERAVDAGDVADVGPAEAAPPEVGPAGDVSLGPEAPDAAAPVCPGLTELAPLADWDTWPACTKAELGRRVPHAASPSEPATTTAASRGHVLMSSIFPQVP